MASFSAVRSLAPHPALQATPPAAERARPHPDAAVSPELGEIYRQHAEFVWRCLQRFGVPEADQPDVLQEVFMVVHLKLRSFEGRSQLTTWLYGITLRVASGHRRRLSRRRESPLSTGACETGTVCPVAVLEQRQAAAHLEQILNCLPPAKRAVFVMFEIEGLSCEEIAALQGTKLGTVYSRLHHARSCFVKELEKHQAKGLQP